MVWRLFHDYFDSTATLGHDEAHHWFSLCCFRVTIFCFFFTPDTDLV